MTIGITGASGPFGRATAELALQTVDPGEVVLLTRTPEGLGEFAARGVRVRPADFTDPASLRPAFTGVDRLLVISTDAVGARLDQHRAAIAAAAEAGVEHVVYTSFPEPVPTNPALVVDDHAGTEAALHSSGVAWTVLRNSLYAHMQVATVDQAIASGQLVTNAGSGAIAYVTREDCAAAAAAVLTQGGHVGATYDVTGPEAVGAAEMAAIARAVGAAEVEVLHVDDDAYLAGLLGAGLPRGLAELITSFGAAARGGFLAEVSPAVHDLTGRPPRSLAEVVGGRIAR